MNLTSPSQVKAWCIENGFHPNKVLGQNFLIDQNALLAIVDAGLTDVADPAGAEVLEIGPGMGVLTEEMLKRGCKVTAIEKDPVLAERLEKWRLEQVAETVRDGLRLITGDALEVLARPEGFNLRPAAYACMISNLPYQAGTRILLELVKARELKAMTVLVQTEVAERLAAKEGSKTRGLAGVWAQLDYEVKIVRRVAASCFWPRPEIGSTVVRLVRHDRNADLTDRQRQLFFSITKQAFEHRRKQLGTIFKNMIYSTARAEELSNSDWVGLVKALTKVENQEGEES